VLTIGTTGSLAGDLHHELIFRSAAARLAGDLAATGNLGER
jgi:hypothetical protein